MHVKSLLFVLALFTFAARALAGVEQTVNDLIPKLASPTVAERFAPQMELQALAANAARPGAESERAALATLLAAKVSDSTIPQPARVWMVRQLEYIGAQEAVAALTGLLGGPDAELQECARRALERNPAPDATKSLREALAKAEPGVFKIGLIQSLGQRADAEAAPLITACLANPQTAPAALLALGQIANEAAVKELLAAFEKKVPGAGEALITAAGRLMARGDREGASTIYKGLYVAGAGTPLRPAALVGLAKADPVAAKPLLAEAVTSGDPRMEGSALSVVEVVYGRGGAAFLAPLLPGLKGPAKIRALGALASVSDSVAEAQVQTAANDGDEAVRLAALEALGRIGGVASAPILLQAVAQGDGPVKKAAAAALARLPGPGVNAALVEQAGQGDPKVRAAAIQALADRHDASALPTIWKYVSDPAVASPALGAIGKAGGDSDLEPLAKLVLAGEAPDASAALQSVAARVTDKSAAVVRLVALIDTAAPQRAGALFETLAILGGDAALAAVVKSAASANDEVKDAALRALAGWPDFAATKPLLAVAADPSVKRVHQVLAIQGVARLVQSTDTATPAERVEAASQALTLAQRPEDRKLVLSALASVGNAKAAEAIKPLLTDPALKDDAGPAAASLAEALVRTDRAAAKSLAQAITNSSPSADVLRRAGAVLRR